MSTTKAVLKCEDEQKKIFSESRCLLTISVGQEAHEGDKFLATIELVNRSFKSCIMLIDDSLQRHTMALANKKTPDELYEKAIQEGNLWLDRNRVHIEKLTILEKIIRWGEWLQHREYPHHKTTIEEEIKKNAAYRSSFDTTISSFLERYCKRNKWLQDQDTHSQKLCFDYLLEECSAFCLWPETNCHFEVYPGKRNAALNETHRLFVLPKYPTLLYPVWMKFKGRKQFAPQHFELLETA